MVSWSFTTWPGLLTFRIWRSSLAVWAKSCAQLSSPPLLLPYLIAGCQVELEGTGRLSGPGESPITSGSKCTALHGLLLAAAHCPCWWSQPVDS